MKKIFTFSLLLVSLYVSAQTPFAHYPMNGNANDVSGNNKHGVAQDTGSEPDRNNNPNSAMYFNSAWGSKIEVADTAGFGNGNGSVTVAAWFNCINNNGVNSVFTSGMQGFAKGIFFCVGYVFFEGRISFALAGESGTGSLIFIHSDGKFNDNIWHHAAVVVDKATDVASMYVDGKKVKLHKFSGFGQTGKGTLQADSTELNITGLVNSSTPTQSYIGLGTSSGAMQNFSGLLDELYYFKEALTASQVQALYNGGAIGINNTKSNFEIAAYPNPSNGILNLKNTSGKASFVKVFDTQGRIVMTFNTEGLYDTINLTELSNGIYMLMFDNGNNLRIIKE